MRSIFIASGPAPSLLIANIGKCDHKQPRYGSQILAPDFTQQLAEKPVRIRTNVRKNE